MITDFLLDWAEQFFKSRDAFEKKIITLKKKQDHLEIEYKDKNVKIYMMPNLKKSKELENNTTITLNNRKNLDFLIENWNFFEKIEGLKIYFINPFSEEKKWIISPIVHTKISDPSSLKIGLKSLFESVDTITEEILSTKL